MNKKRIAFYLCLIVIAAVCVVLQQRHIAAGRQDTIASTYSVWQHVGKPVIVRKIEPANVDQCAKLTIVPKGNGRFVGYVPRDVQQALKAGQRATFSGVGRALIAGTILAVSEDIDNDTGLYLVDISFSGDDASTVSRGIAEVLTTVVEQAIFIPGEIIDIGEERPTVWVVSERRAHKRQVTVGRRNRQGAEIVQGLYTGDLLVVEGFSSLVDNDLVNIVNDKSSGLER